MVETLDDAIVEAKRLLEILEPYLEAKRTGRFAVLVGQDGACLDINHGNGKPRTLKCTELANGWFVYS